MSVDGILNVNKPEGKTSFSIVAQIRHLSGEKHVGHTGTLDPLATGVLLVCLGKATKIIQFLVSDDKTYRAEIELGVSTDTYDREGTIVSRKDSSGITLEQVQTTLTSFQGIIEQIPPRYSALKYKGRKYYDLARAGEYIELKARKVEIKNINLISFQSPLLTIVIDCGKGTYIRSLAHDIGEVLGCGAHLKNLIRLRCGIFRIEEALTFSQIESAYKHDTWQDVLYPIDKPLDSWGKVVLEKDEENAVKNGNSISLHREIIQEEDYICAYNSVGKFIAVLQFNKDGDLWHPRRVFAP